MNEENYKKMIQILRSPGGILYLTGPTGCGKTTTLYLILEYLLRQPVNIVTIEDPVERYLPGISQIQVNEQAGLTSSVVQKREFPDPAQDSEPSLQNNPQKYVRVIT